MTGALPPPRNASGQAAPGRLSVLECLQASALVLTPWQANGATTLLGWAEEAQKRHDGYYREERTRPPQPWHLEVDPHALVPYLYLGYGEVVGQMQVSGYQFTDRGVVSETFIVQIFDGPTRRVVPDNLLVGLNWDLGPGAGLVSSSDPVGDTFRADDSLYPELWYTLLPLAILFARERRLLRLLAASEGVKWLLEAILDAGKRVLAGEEVPLGFRGPNPYSPSGWDPYLLEREDDGNE